MPIRKDMIDRYPKDWKLRSRFVREVRAQNQCEWCGAVNKQPHPVTKSIVVLTCAHIFDHRPEAKSLLNLAALCNYCHLRHDREMHIINRRINKLKKIEAEGQQTIFVEDAES